MFYSCSFKVINFTFFEFFNNWGEGIDLSTIISNLHRGIDNGEFGDLFKGFIKLEKKRLVKIRIF
tara:strand:+ start:2693 stop:2887 length:195 start_codon:yes stop_codon:yes gene_type:complete